MLPRLGGALGPLLLAAARGALRGRMPSAATSLATLPGAAVGVVLAAARLPGATRQRRRRSPASTTPAGSAPSSSTPAPCATAGGWATNGGRILTVVGRGPDLAAARAVAERAADAIDFAGAQRRHDIGARARPRSRRGRGPMIPRYTLPEMGAIWSDAARFEAMLRVELAVARAAGGPRAGPARRARGPRDRAPGSTSSGSPRSSGPPTTTSSPSSARSPRPSARRAATSTSGLTSSDVVDTGLALQLRAAGERLLADCDRLLAVLVARARAEADTVMMGRTHSVHAEPTTLGLKLAGWAFELDRGRTRLAAAVDEIGTGKISGPVGTYSHLGPDIEAEVLAALGLHVDPVSTQIVQRDRHAALLTAIAILGGSLERFATEIRNLQHTEIGELQEPFKAGQKGSLGDAPQAQPDPVRADRRSRPAPARLRPHGARGPAALARARHQPLERRAGDPARRDDRPRLHARADDRARRGPPRPLRADAREHRARPRASTPRQPRPRRARRAGGLSREEAYAIVQRASLRAADERVPLRDLLAVDPAVAQRLSLARLDACFDDAAFLRHVPEVIARLDGLADRAERSRPRAARVPDAG